MFRKERLSNGLTVVMERVKGVRSVSLGIWVKVGSRDEHASKAGLSHFLEHMFFKGTKNLTARDIAFEIDSIGGDMNAFTSKESTTFYVKVLDEHLKRGLGLLTDVFSNSLLKSDDIEKEKGVVDEEIKMTEDTPDDLVHDIFSRSVWGNTGLGRAILGSRASVKALTRKDLIGHVRSFYGVDDIVISCAGNFDPDELLSMIEDSMGSVKTSKRWKREKTPEFHPVNSVHEKDLSEVHFCMGLQGFPQASQRRYAYSILNTILGSGVSSRLFQEIREERGLVYSIYSFISSYSDTGLWGIYAGTGKRKVQEVIELVCSHLSDLPDTLSEKDLRRAKDQLKGNMVLALESSGNRMQNIAKQEIYYGKYYSPRQIMKAVEDVTLKDIRETATELIRGKTPALTVLGPVNKSTFKGHPPVL